MPNIPISVVIITYNEEKNIARCLESVRLVADDVVVIDSFSTDKTAAICARHKIRFLQHAFAGHIEQKNYAIGQAKYPHILSLDADECLSPELQQAILTVKKDWQFDAYYCNRLNNFCGQWIRHGEWYPDRKLRLWDSRKGQWAGDNPHDKFVLYDVNTLTSRLKGDLLHYSFTSIQQHLQQINKFTDIKAAVLYQKGKKATAYHLYVKPFLKFCLSYFVKMGFLDGFYGFVISKNSAHADFLKYAKLRELWKNEGY